MKPVTKFWLFLAGLSAVLLLGQIFADYADLRGGVIRILMMFGVLVAAAGAVNVVMEANNGKRGNDLKDSIRGSVWLAGGVMAVLLLVVMIGGL